MKHDVLSARDSADTRLRWADPCKGVASRSAVVQHHTHTTIRSGAE